MRPRRTWTRRAIFCPFRDKGGVFGQILTLPTAGTPRKVILDGRKFALRKDPVMRDTISYYDEVDEWPHRDRYYC